MAASSAPPHEGPLTDPVAQPAEVRSDWRARGGAGTPFRRGGHARRPHPVPLAPGTFTRHQLSFRSHFCPGSAPGVMAMTTRSLLALCLGLALLPAARPVHASGVPADPLARIDDLRAQGRGLEALPLVQEALALHPDDPALYRLNVLL